MDRTIPFTICFLMQNDQVLLIYRKKKPWINHWNGVGGKLLPHEKPSEGMIRETYEETGIDLKKAEKTIFTGIVTWSTNRTLGMYVFISYLSENQPTWTEERETPEGPLAWKPLSWVLDRDNPYVARNIPAFLSPMLTNTKPMEYFCNFDTLGNFMNVDTLPLPDTISIT